MSLEVSQDMPLKYDRPLKAQRRLGKMSRYSEMCQIKGLKDYIHYHMMNVANKYYESREDWEKLTAKGFIRSRVNIAPTLPPNEAPSAQVTKPPLPSTTLSEIGKRGSSMT